MAASLAVLSGKGGVGKSAVSALLAGLSARSSRTLLVDADLGAANAHLFLGVAAGHTLEDALDGSCPLAECVVRVRDRLSLLPSRTGTVAHGDPARRLCPLVEQLEDRFDRVLLDAGPGMAPVSLGRLADGVLIVTTPGVAALTDAYGVLKALSTSDERPPVLLVVNRARDEEEGLRAATRLRQVASRFLGWAPEFVGVLPEDPEVPRALERRRALLDQAPDSAMVVAAEAAWSRITGELSRRHPHGLGGRSHV